MVMRLRGRLSLELVKAPRRRSLASSTALFAMPTITMLGRLLEMWHSISTSVPPKPWSIRLRTFTPIISMIVVLLFQDASMCVL